MNPADRTDTLARERRDRLGTHDLRESADVPFAALSLDDRIRRTSRLAQEGGSDRHRWHDARNLHPQWDIRAVRAAHHVPAGAHVLDLGAGAQALRGVLPAGCRYTPSDLIARTPDTLVADLNRGEFPRCHCDVITALGVLEYLHHLDVLFTRMREAAPRAIISYSAVIGGSAGDRLQHGWMNSFTLPALLALTETAGWTATDRELLNADDTFEQWLVVLDATVHEER